MRLWGVLLGFVAMLDVACKGAPPEPAARSAPSTSAAPGVATEAPRLPPADADRSFRSDAPERLVAVGDLHGDLPATRKVLRLAGAIDDRDRWMGGKLVLVQTGDQIDRGDDDRAVLELFDRLADAAEAAGGRVVALNGNHEAMNVAGDFRYVTRPSFAAFAGFDTTGVPGTVLANFPAEARQRLAAFLPGGPFARRLGLRDVVRMIGDTVFVHGGVTADHVRYGLGRLNGEVKRWMNGQGSAPALASDPEGPLWTRRYSDDGAKPDCEGLGAALVALGAKRMVVGHTPHEKGISPACDERVWRIDTGISRHYGGVTEALEIRGDKVGVLRAETAKTGG